LQTKKKHHGAGENLLQGSRLRKRRMIEVRGKNKEVFWFILLRLIIVTSLLIAAVIIQYTTAAFLPTLFYYLVIFVYFLSAVYLVLYFRAVHRTFQVALQIFFDLLLITAFVYFSGGLKGSFYFLYVFEIIAASIVLSRRAAYLTAAASGVLFGVLVNGMHLGFLPYIGGERPMELTPGLVVNNIAISWSVFFVVALLVNTVTERLKSTAEKLRLAEKELEIKKRLALAGEFSAYLAHEIRNPLAAISGAVQVLKEELALEESQQKLMNHIVEQSRRVSQSIEQFLALASPGQRGFADLDLRSVVEETLLILAQSGEWNGKVRVEGNFRSFPLFYYGSPGQFKQLFWNLLRNAIRAMPEGGTIKVDFKREGRDQVRLVVEHTGSPPAEAAAPLNPLGSELPEDRFGLEVGMSVVRRIVDDYDGKLRVSIGEEGGRRWVITLPGGRVGGKGGARAR